MESQLRSCPYRHNEKRKFIEPYNLIGDDFMSDDKIVNSKGNHTFRKGQYKYRRILFQEMGGKCIITGVTNPHTLEACHIKPYYICDLKQKYDAKNGLILRRDVHGLFDNYELSINPKTLRTIIINDIHYNKYNNIYLKILENDTNRLAYLKNHYTEFCKKNEIDE